MTPEQKQAVEKAARELMQSPIRDYSDQQRWLRLRTQREIGIKEGIVSVITNPSDFGLADPVEFLKWIGGAFGFNNIIGVWYRYANTDETYTEAQLFEIYQKSKV